MSECRRADNTIKNIRRKQISFILKQDDSLYAVIKDEKNDRLVMCIKWNLYNGFVRDESAEVPQYIIAIANKIIELGETDKKRYRLRGEWYAVNISRDGELHVSIRYIKGKSYTAIKAISHELLKLFLAFAMAGILLTLFSRPAGEWLYSILPYFENNSLRLHLIGIELIGTVLLYFGLRKNTSFLGAVLIPYIPIGSVIVTGLLKCYKWPRIVVPIAACLVFVIAMLFSCMIQDKKWHKSIGGALKNTIIFVSVLFLIVISVININTYTYKGRVNDTDAMSNEELEAWHDKTCEYLERSVWESLTAKEKVDVLQRISDYECISILGCDKVTVVMGKVESERALAYYTNEERRITIKDEHVENGDVSDIIMTVLHETRHAYQNDIVEMYKALEDDIDEEYKSLLIFSQVREFRYNFQNYYSSSEDLELYRSQTIEVDSRAWASERYYDEYYYWV